MSSQPNAISAAEVRRVLLVEPVFHVHALVYCEAAVASAGFENARFSIASYIQGAIHRERMEEFAQRDPRVDLRLLEGVPSPLTNRLQNWRTSYRSMRQVESMLRLEQFDLVAYLKVDGVLPFLAFPLFRTAFRAHWAARVSGLVFSDQGLRVPPDASWRHRARGAVDRFILGRAARSRGIRRLPFLDPKSADLAQARWGGEICRPGMDPIFVPPVPPSSQRARARFGIPGDACVALLFGAFSERKAIVQMLELLAETALPRPLFVLLGGRVEPSIRERFDRALAAVKARHAVHLHDGFVSDAEVPDFFAAADLVLCAYNDFTGSSGILLHAAAHGKPALVSPNGAMADAVTRHGFGEVVDLKRPETFQTALARLAALSDPERTALAERARGYAKLNDARLYLAQFL